MRIPILSLISAALAAGMLAAPAGSAAQTAPTGASADPPPVRIRGTMVYIDSREMIVKDRGGEVVALTRAPEMPISELFPIRASDIRKGSFVGTGAVPQADGTLKAVQVVVFPESARGLGEGHRPWDVQPDGTMTNATVAELGTAAATTRGGERMLLRYKDGEKTVVIPHGTPIMSFRPGNEALLVPGATVTVSAQEKAGMPTALRVQVGGG